MKYYHTRCKFIMILIIPKNLFIIIPQWVHTLNTCINGYMCIILTIIILIGILHVVFVAVLVYITE